jgi:elongation factor Ts
LKIPTDQVKELREQSGAGIMECRNALIETEGDIEKALQILKENSIFMAERKKERTTLQGLIEAYVHAKGRIGALVEVNCETDFAANTDEFKELAHNLSMQVAAMNPKYISEEDIPKGVDVEEAKVDCLLLQPFIKDPEMTVQDIVNDTIAKVRENIQIKRFIRFSLTE